MTAEIAPDIAPDVTDGWFSAETATLGDRLAGAREAAGMTQEQLATRLGVKPKTLAAWEDDLSEPRTNRLSILSGLLGVSIMWLLTGQGEGLEAPAESADGERTLTDAMSETLGEMRQLRGEITSFAERLGRLEKRLRQTLKEAGQ